MDVHIAQTLYTTIDKSLSSTLATGTSNVMMGAGAVFGVFWLIHLNLKTIHWCFQGLDVAVEDLILTMFKAAFIVYFAFNVGWYISTIVPFVNDVPVWVGNTLSSNSGNQTNQVDAVIGQFLEALIETAKAMKASAADWEFGQLLIGIFAILFLLIGGIPFLSVCVGTLITLKAATTAILVLGPVFIAFSLFPVTRQYFFGWVGVIGGFMLTQILFSVILALEMNFINSNIVSNGQIQSDLLSSLSILFYFSAFTLLATELPMYAASIMGGAPMGASSGVGGLLGKGTGIRSAASMSRAVGKGTRWAYDKARNRNRIG